MPDSKSFSHHSHVACLLVYCLVVVQKRSSFTILLSRSCLSTESELLAEEARNCNDQCRNKESGHNGKSEDPLKCYNLSQELGDTKSSGQDTQLESHSVVFEGDQEETSKHQDTPDGNVSENAGRQGLSMNCDGAIPVQSNEGPS